MEPILIATLVASSLIFGGFIGVFFYRKVGNFSEKLKFQQDENLKLNQELTEARATILKFEKDLSSLQASHNHIKQENIDHKEENLKLNEKLADVLEKQTRAEAKNNSLLERINEQKNEIEKIQNKFKEELKTSQEKLHSEFKLLANNIFEEKTTKFKLDSKDSLEGLLTPLKENLSNFKKEFVDKFEKENEGRIRLENEIKNLKDLSSSLSQEANNLSSALSGSVKAQGNWGEVILERVLKHSGLKEGVDFIREGKGLGLKDEDNKRQKPDVIVNLPDEKHLIIDSKVTLNSYTKYISSDIDQEKSLALTEFLKCVKDRINELSGKRYESNNKMITPEYVFLFMPIESAISLALENDPTLFEYGWEKQIILVGPTNLLSTLKAVESVWRHEKHNKNALEIARLGGNLYDKFVGFLNDMDKIKSAINKTEEAYDSALKKLHTGRGNAISIANKMKGLGAKTKGKTLIDPALHQKALEHTQEAELDVDGEEELERS